MPIPFDESTDDISPATFIRRIAAIFYDFLIAFALLMMTTGLYKVFQAGIIGADELQRLTDNGKMDVDPLLSSILFIVLYTFFAFFWTRTGQTLGMQVWHIRIQTPQGRSITWSQALLRYMMAWLSVSAFGLGYLWILIDKKKRSWQDIFSMTEVVRIPKKLAQ